MVDLLVSKLVKSNIIDEKEQAKYRYGVNALTVLVPGTLLFFIVGAVLQELLFTTCFFLVLALVRAFYPGSHLPSKLWCLLVSVAIFTACILFKKYSLSGISAQSRIVFFICICTIMQVVRVRFMETPKHKNQVTARQCVIILMGVEVIYFVTMIVNVSMIHSAIFIAVSCNCILFLLETIRKCYIKN